MIFFLPKFALLNLLTMIQFQCDYNEGAHPRILERMIETNFIQTVGYGEDQYCEDRGQ